MLLYSLYVTHNMERFSFESRCVVMVTINEMHHQLQPKNTKVTLYVTIFRKIDHLRASNEIHFLPVKERYIHALSRNTNCLTIDGQVCFYRRLFTDAVKPRGCISCSWGALIGLHGVPNCSSRQSWPPQHCSLSLNWCFTPPSAPHPPPPPTSPPSHPP